MTEEAPRVRIGRQPQKQEGTASTDTAPTAPTLQGALREVWGAGAAAWFPRTSVDQAWEIALFT